MEGGMGMKRREERGWMDGWVEVSGGRAKLRSFLCGRGNAQRGLPHLAVIKRFIESNDS
jgi:hypothetical protein